MPQPVTDTRIFSQLEQINAAVAKYAEPGETTLETVRRIVGKLEAAELTLLKVVDDITSDR